jgi:hypothetical protein
VKLALLGVYLLLGAAELAGDAFEAGRLVYRLLRDARRAARSQRRARDGRRNLRPRCNSPGPRG